MQYQKQQNDLCSFPKQTTQYHSNPSICITSDAEEAEVEQCYEDLQNLLELILKKRCPFHYRGLKCKGRKSRNTWSNRQIWPWSTEWSRANANRVLPRECTSHSKHPRPTTQEKTLHTWESPYDQYRNQIDYISCSQRWRSSTESAKTIPGADCGSDSELLIAKCRLKLKKVGKITRPFSYDLNQILYNYTAEVTNRFKGLDLTDRVPEEQWTEVWDIIQKPEITTTTKEINVKRQNGCLRKPYK